MRRIPFGGERDGVLSNLVPATRVQMARAGGAEIVAPSHLPASLAELDLAFRALFAYASELGIPADEQAYFVDRLLLLLTSCKERRFAEYEHQSWWEFSGAQTRSAAYGKFLADGLTRTLVAAKAREMSARTGGYILLQLLFDLSRPGRPGRPGAERSHERRLDRSVARAPALARRRLPQRAPGAGDPLRRRADQRRRRRRRRQRIRGKRRSLRRRAAGRGDAAAAQRRAQARRSPGSPACTACAPAG